MCHFTSKRLVLLVVLLVLGNDCSHFNNGEIKAMLGTIRTHENVIMEILQHPKLNSSITLMESLEKFNQEFVQLVSAIKEPNCTFKNIKSFCDEGPKFLNLKIDNDQLKKTFNWSEDLLQEMYYVLGVSEVLWFELKQLDPKGEHYPIMDNMTKDELTFLKEMDKDNRLNEFMEFTKLNDFQRTDVPPRKSVIDR